MPGSNAPPPAATRLYRVHETGRRARLRPAEPMDRDGLIGLANALATGSGVDRVLARPATGSLIVETSGPVAPVLAAMEAEGQVAFAPPPKAPPVRQTVQLGLAKADYDLQRSTEGSLDLRTALGLLLLGGAILQLARGQIAGPATTLAASALTLLDPGGGRR